MRKPDGRSPLTCGLTWLLVAALSPAAALASPIGTLVGQLSQADYQGYVTDLQGFGTRYYNTTGNANAANYLSSTST